MNSSENQQSSSQWLSLLVEEIPLSLLALLVTVGTFCLATFLSLIWVFAWGPIPLLAYIPFVVSGAVVTALPKLPRKLMGAIGSFAVGMVIVAVGIWTGALSSSIMDVNFALNDLLKLFSSDFGIGILAGMCIQVMLHLSMKRLRGAHSLDLVSRRTLILNTNVYVTGFLICAGVLVIISNMLGLGDTSSSSGLFVVCLAEVFVGLVFNTLDFLLAPTEKVNTGRDGGA